MKIELIDEKTFTDFVSKHEYATFYQSVEWMKVKSSPNRNSEMLGLFEDNKLVGASIVFYVGILRKYSFAYLSRGFVYDYSNIPEFKKALLNYFSKKKVVFIKIDPPVVYQTKIKKDDFVLNKHGAEILNNLIKSNFNHYGFNKNFETYQMRYIHHLYLNGDYDALSQEFEKSTKRNINIATHKGVKIEKKTIKDLKLAISFFDETAKRKKFESFEDKFYESVINNYKDNASLYLVYIDKETYLQNAKDSLQESKKELSEINIKKEREIVGKGLIVQEKLALNKINKYELEIEEALNLNENKTYIASMITITKYEETVSFVSGMNANYKSFFPKYVLYPQMIRDAIDLKNKTINFLGVSGIFDPKDKNYGIYEIKKGFGGEVVEYIGEFDLVINKKLYKLYKLLSNIKKHI